MGAMTAAEVRAIREGLGVTAEWLADYVDVQTRTVQRWESGQNEIKPFAAEAIAMLEADAQRQVEAHVEAMRAFPPSGSPVMVIEDTGQSGDWPAGWQRMIAFRVRQQIPTLRIVDTNSYDGPASEVVPLNATQLRQIGEALIDASDLLARKSLDVESADEEVADQIRREGLAIGRRAINYTEAAWKADGWGA
ncbi:helix-turn-helix domain-containing protein [Mycobacterium sp. SMC-13]|uniref:helix-turn-helix domain-containing protein n=1 Tax=Mycobacterium sp. SMC-13 TaxID=3381626 RepID=UPI0038763DB5